jgi:hypothetical protein
MHFTFTDAEVKLILHALRAEKNQQQAEEKAAEPVANLIAAFEAYPALNREWHRLAKRVDRAKRRSPKLMRDLEDFESRLPAPFVGAGIYLSTMLLFVSGE